ncbi:hypothetical protein, partial [Methanoculleus chikugoensis]
MLSGDDARIRCEAAATLGEIGDPAAVGGARGCPRRRGRR